MRVIKGMLFGLMIVSAILTAGFFVSSLYIQANRDIKQEAATRNVEKEKEEYAKLQVISELWYEAQHLVKAHTGDGNLQVVIYSCESEHFKVYFQDRGQEFLLESYNRHPEMPHRVAGIRDLLLQMKYAPSPFAKIVVRGPDDSLLPAKLKVIIERYNPSVVKTIIDNTQ